MATLTAANTARQNAMLDKLVRTSRYGVVTYREFVTRTLADGGHEGTATVANEALRSKMQREYDLLNRGFNVPWGNSSHPMTIKAQTLKNALAGTITCTEYRLYAPREEYWSVIPKMVYDFATTVGRD